MNPSALLRGGILASLLVVSTCGAERTDAPNLASATNANTNQVYLIDLPTTLRLAHAQNLDVQIALERLKEARANRVSAVEQFFPWVAPGVGFGRHDGRIQAVDGTMLDADKQAYTVGAALATQVDLRDAIYRALASKQLVYAADEALESQRQETALAAAQGYYDLAKAKAIAEVVKEALQISADYQRQVHDAVGAGLAFRGDELRVRVQTERYQIALRQAVEQQRVSAARLAQTLHLDSSVELLPLENDLAPLTLVESGASLEALVRQALLLRPELKQTQALVTAARDAKNSAVYGPLIPSISGVAFAGGVGGGKDNATGNFGPSEDYFLGLGWRIGPGGLFDSGRIQASRARLESARLAGDKLRDDIIRQVVESHTRTQSLLDQLGTARQNLTTTAETLKLTRERKQFGVGAVLEDIQAQQELTRARSDYLSTVAEFNKAQYALVRAIASPPPAPKPDGKPKQP